MGCPDWPKCFGQWIPPSSESELPENYKDLYSEKRASKIEKFAQVLRNIGLEETSEQLKNDPNLRVEQDFNSKKTWIEYVNRLFGFFAGNAMLCQLYLVDLEVSKKKIDFPRRHQPNSNGCSSLVWLYRRSF